MSVAVTCQSCGKEYSLKDEMAGQVLACAKCGASIEVPGERTAPAPQADPVFDRDKFLLRQKIAIDTKYAVWDEQGRDIAYIVRPTHLGRNLLALLVGVAAAVAVWVGGAVVVDKLPRGILFDVLGTLTVLGGLAVLFVVAIGLSVKRHITFYRDESRRSSLLEVLQDKKFQPIVATYTVRTPAGETLANLRKNYLFNIFRKRWYCDAPDGSRICVAKEESIILSMLRRLLGPLFGLLRTNFIILRGDSDDVIGEFNRKLTILDRYVLDMSQDRARKLDRRIALAIGVMLDTGERR
ncbi:MAG: hypothetical protein Q8S13_14445 [Dehalococcoidia bacterium]|nr:hypothetical protein [Dehalococcoidia bacterium]